MSGIPQAFAYPPAPGVVVEGIVRDEFGYILTDDAAEIVFKSGSKVIARAPIAYEVNFDWNYRVLLPVDAGLTGDPYRSGALLQASLFTAEIHIGPYIYLPIETLAGGFPAPDPSTTLTLNLTLGDDTDEDGLPDDWEYWQLQIGGIFPGNEDYHLGTLGVLGDYDGDGVSDLDEFLGGTIATIDDGGLEFTILGVTATNRVDLQFFATADKSYQVESSIDGIIWEVIPVAVGTPLAPGQLAWTATTGGYIPLFSMRDVPIRLYRLRTQ